MSFFDVYKNQVELLLEVLPFIQEDSRFALKGGTAINLFHRNMPRLSVDIDLTYLPIEPRDIFLDNLSVRLQNLSDKIAKKGLYVEPKRSACSPRPMNELLAPNKLEFNEVFQKEFIGMTNENVSYSDLHNVRNKLIKTIQSSLLPNEKEFLISIKTGEPVWDLMPLHNLSELPGIRWKILNIQKMDKESRLSALEKLKKVLDY